MATYNKNISTDFSGKYNPNRWKQEIEDSGFTPVLIDVDDDNTTAIATFDSTLSGGEITTFDAIPATHSLAEAKFVKNKEIDMRTKELIDDGFVSGAKTYSASILSKLKWTELYNRRDSMSYPFYVQTKDDSESIDMVNAAGIVTIYNDMSDTLIGHVKSGAALKKDVIDATDIAGVDAVTDAR